MKVKTRKGKVSAPKALLNIFPKPNRGIMPMATMVMMLGQSMEIPIHMMMEPRKMPRTCMESWLSPAGAGMNLAPNISSRDTTMMVLRFTALPLPMSVLTDITIPSYVSIWAGGTTRRPFPQSGIRTVRTV